MPVHSRVVPRKPTMEEMAAAAAVVPLVLAVL